MKQTTTDVLIIGAGQTGLTIAYYLKDTKCKYLLVEANARIGDSWRNRYDSLSLLTPRLEDSLPGMVLPGEPMGFPTKDEIADYLERYAKHFSFPIHLNTFVERLSKEKDVFLAKTKTQTYIVRKVIVATGPFQKAFIPSLPGRTDLNLFQIHSHFYKNPGQLPKGRVLIVGAGNSGAQIAVELSATDSVTLSTKRKLIFSSRYDFLYRIVAAVFKIGTVRKIVDLLTVRKVFATGLEELIKNKKIKLVQELIRVNGNIFFFKDGSKETFDAVVWATGYQFDYGWIEVRKETPGLYIVYPKEDYGFIRDLPEKTKPIAEGLRQEYSV